MHSSGSSHSLKSKLVRIIPSSTESQVDHDTRSFDHITSSSEVLAVSTSVNKFRNSPTVHVVPSSSQIIRLSAPRTNIPTARVISGDAVLKRTVSPISSHDSAKRSRLVSPMTFTSRTDIPDPQRITNPKDVAIPAKIQYTSASKQLFESLGGKKRVCNCSKSLCLKLYCECFANGEFCFSCNCTNCFNTLENEFERQQAVRNCLERNPHAFHPKVGKASFSEERSHYKGCNCRRSGCLKNYCECYEAKILCSSVCKCIGCNNTEEVSGRRHYGDITALKTLKMRTLRDFSNTRSEHLEKTPPTRMTQEIVEATVQCLLAQSEEAAICGRSQIDTEASLIQEFGSCLNKVIASHSTRNSQNS